MQSWSWSESQSGTSNVGGGVGAGKVTLQPFQFTSYTSKASPKLFLAGASGQHLKTATLTGRRSEQQLQDFLKITLSDVQVVSFEATSSTETDQLPIEHLSLSYAKIVYEFTPQKADGSPDTIVKAGWDVKASKAIA